VASAPQIIFYERQHSLPNTLSLVLAQYVNQADERGAAVMSRPQKAQVKHSHEFTLQFRDDHFVYARDLLSKSIRVQCGSLYAPLDVCLASKSHPYVFHGSPYTAGQSTFSLNGPAVPEPRSCFLLRPTQRAYVARRKPFCFTSSMRPNPHDLHRPYPFRHAIARKGEEKGSVDLLLSRSIADGPE
jgi:hypothetical protein